MLMLQDLQICTKQNKWALRSYSDKTKQTKNQSNGLPNLISEDHLNSISELRKFLR